MQQQMSRTTRVLLATSAILFLLAAVIMVFFTKNGSREKNEPPTNSNNQQTQQTSGAPTSSTPAASREIGKTAKATAPPPSPDLTWRPMGFVFKAGAACRYIDFADGKDSNAGTKESPWQHHPWDKNATANAAACTGVKTYIFKQGVTYYGALDGKESGNSQEPIRLTSDPAWGKGEAVLAGSMPIRGGWSRCTDADTAVPSTSRKQTWYLDLDQKFTPRLLWENRDGKLTRVPLARTPNWKITNPDDPRSEWWELTGYILEVEIGVESSKGFKVGDQVTGTGKWIDLDETRDNIAKGNNRISEVGRGYLKIESKAWRNGEIKPGAMLTNGRVKTRVRKTKKSYALMRRLVDTKHLTQTAPNYYVGAAMYAEMENMPIPKIARVLAYNPGEHSLRINFHRAAGKGPQKYCRYFLEGIPQFLDSENEWCYVEKGSRKGRLYLRLAGNRDPNTTTIEVAKHNILIKLNNQRHLVISGLSLRSNNQIEISSSRGRTAPWYSSLVMLSGSCQNIAIRNCRLSEGTVGVAATPAQPHDIADQLLISDNDIRDIDGAAIVLSNGVWVFTKKNWGARLKRVRVLRNRVYNTGSRPRAHWGMGGVHSVTVTGGEIVEVAGNVVDRVWGAGILVFTGAPYNKGKVERPFLRTLIHHNKVTNSLLGAQDYGGIAAWMGGPAYIYNNISGNSVGYKHADFRKQKKLGWYRNSAYGVGIYLDGQYKGYVFNNICWGTNNNVRERMYSACAFNEAMGFMNTVFNNTFYNFGIGLHKGMNQHNRCYYLGNLMLDIGHKFIQQEPSPKAIEYDSLAWAKNVFYGKPENFGQLGHDVYATLPDWQAAMREKKTLVPTAGKLASEVPVVAMKKHDFRLRRDSAAIDSGAKVFVPWALSAVVGEWNFLKHPADPTVIMGENIYMNSEWVERGMYQFVPRNNLIGHGIRLDDYISGTLEDWTAGALRFNGKDQYCELKQASLSRGYKWGPTRKGKRGRVARSERKTVDMGTNSFLLEMVFQTTPGHVAGGLVSKMASHGYELTLDTQGRVLLTLQFSGSTYTRKSSLKVNAGAWHHLLVEVDRQAREARIFIDGKAANGASSGQMSAAGSLANSGDFLVGKNSAGKYFSGAFDFLRISRGTLAAAETTINELYRWEFFGPFHKDFNGRAATGKRRDAGALEYSGE